MTRFTLDWSSANIDGANTVGASGQTTDFDISTPANAEGIEWFVATFNGEPGLRGQRVQEEMELAISFDEPVENLSFEIFDVDANLTGDLSGWDDKITVVALDADGNQVPVAFTDLAFHHSVSGNVLDTDGAASDGIEGSGQPDTVGVNIAGPIVSLTIIYDNDGGPEDSGVVGISNISFGTVGPDGYVEGDSGNNTIDPGYDDDPDGDVIDGADAVLPGEGADDDIVLAGGGDDIVRGRDGADTIFGGEGEDDLRGNGGADTIFGDNPTFDGTLDLGGLSAGDIVQQQFIENGVRVSSFNDDNQVMVFDADNPTGGDGDLGVPGLGNVLILSEDGDSSDPDDNASGGTFVFEFTGPATVNSLDFIDQGAGAEIRFYDEDGALIGEIDTPPGADNTVFTQAIAIPDVFRMEVSLPGAGALANLDYTLTNADLGNDDTIRGGGGADTIYGQAGDDTLFGNGGTDTIFGGTGADQITGGGGADQLSGGTGSDTFFGGTDGDVVIGGEDDDGSDFDILNLIGADVDFITFDVGDPEAGVVTFNNGDTMAFSEIERVIPCFTAGTLIATPKGEVLVEKLKPGDRILTRDNGIQTVRWVGHKRLEFKDLKMAPQLRPIRISAGALGNDVPDRDMLVSPSHRMLMVSHLAELYFGQSEILVAAKHILALDGVEVAEQPYVTYIHIMCDNHEIVLADGAWSESFQPGDYTLKGFDADQRAELFALFPELETKDGVAAYRAARRTLKRREAKLLFTG